MKNKKVITATVLGLTLAGSGLVAFKEIQTEHPVDRVEMRKQHAPKVITKVNELQAVAMSKNDIDTKDMLDMVLALYERRQNGDEPTEEEWQNAEDTIVKMRQHKDSIDLYHADRLVDLQDADDYWVEQEIASW